MNYTQGVLKLLGIVLTGHFSIPNLVGMGIWIFFICRAVALAGEFPFFLRYLREKYVTFKPVVNACKIDPVCLLERSIKDLRSSNYKYLLNIIFLCFADGFFN